MNHDRLIKHKEIILLNYIKWMKSILRRSDEVGTVELEPCTMCAAALVQARMGKVIYGAPDNKRGGFGGTIDLSKHQSAHHKMNVVKGILENDCEDKLKIWFKMLRNRK